MITVREIYPAAQTSGYSDAAITWRTNILTQGGSISDSVLTWFDTWFFKPAASNGNILNQLDRLNFYVGPSGFTQINANTSIISFTNQVVAVNSPLWAYNTGYTANNTTITGGHLKLSYNPVTQGTLFTQNSNSFGYLCKTPVYVSTTRCMGQASGTDYSMINTDVTPRIVGLSNSGTGGASRGFNTTTTTTNTVNPYTFVCLRRQSSANFDTILNDTIVNTAVTSAALSSYEHYELTANNGGSAYANLDTAWHLASWHGSGNLDVVALKIILGSMCKILAI